MIFITNIQLKIIPKNNTFDKKNYRKNSLKPSSLLPLKSTYRPIPKIRVPIRNIADYSPFGVQLDGRTISMDSYRYGFNGMEKDDEVKGGGNSYDFGARMYDARVGRFLSLDALLSKYPSFSPYSFAANSPISFVDHAGDSIYLVINGVAYNVKTCLTASTSQEIKDMAYYTLKATQQGQRILDKYKNSNQTDVYIAISDIANDNTNGIIQAETTQVGMGIDESGKLLNENIPKGTPLPSTGDYDVFEGVTTKSSGNAFLIVINKDYISGSLSGVKPDRYTIASVLFHEFRVHIEMSNAINAEVDRQMNELPINERTSTKRDELIDLVGHKKYGSYGSPSPTSDSNNFTDISGPTRQSKPAYTIFKQLEKLRNSNIQNSSQDTTNQE